MFVSSRRQDFIMATIVAASRPFDRPTARSRHFLHRAPRIETAILTFRTPLARSLPRKCTRIRVVAGTAYLTHEGEDILLTAGETLTLTSSPYQSLISAVGALPLVIETAIRS
jgi:hypothetical protein